MTSAKTLLYDLLGIVVGDEWHFKEARVEQAVERLSNALALPPANDLRAVAEKARDLLEVMDNDPDLGTCTYGRFRVALEDALSEQDPDGVAEARDPIPGPSYTFPVVEAPDGYALAHPHAAMRWLMQAWPTQNESIEHLRRYLDGAGPCVVPCSSGTDEALAAERAGGRDA